jgi:hypothetical protein
MATDATATSELDAAFVAAFGQKPPMTRVAERDGQATTFSYRPEKLLEIGGRAVLISTGRNASTCHACDGVLAIDYLNRTPAGFASAGHWPEIADGQGFGEPPDWSLRDDLFSAPAIESRTGGTWQGCSVQDATYIELSPDRPRVRTRPILIAYDHEGEAEQQAASLRGAVSSLDKGRAFAVDYAGLVSRRVIYRLSGEAYAPVGSQPDLPEC